MQGASHLSIPVEERAPSHDGATFYPTIDPFPDVIEIGASQTHALAAWLVKPQFFGHIGEASVAGLSGFEAQDLSCVASFFVEASSP